MLMYQGGADEAETAIKTSDETNDRPEIVVDPAILEAYVGVFELRPGFHLTISLENGKLMAQATGQPMIELHAESETEFFINEVDAQVTFVKGTGGRAEELILHQGGRDMPGKRKP